MGSLTAPSTSSSSSLQGGREYDVFLSFRGTDVRNKFRGHLYRALQQRGIHTFIDDKLKRGEEISPSLIQAIRDSKISIIIFSENFASSSWCLDELVEITECWKSLGQLVWPVFLYVDPSDVRNQRGSFELEAVAQYKQSPKKEKLPRWKFALNKVANLSGWHININEDESTYIQSIVGAALCKLNRKSLHVAKHPVGIEELLEDLLPLLDFANDKVRFIGINGIGGIGKTTLAKAVFNRFADSYVYESSSFLADVRETSKKHGMVKIQETLLFDMLGDKKIKVGNTDKGINIIKDRLCRKEVLLVLDDVDEQDQLEKLAGGRDWFGSRSRIIITTRNKHLLTSHGVDGIYEIQGLNDERALELFSWNAFKRAKPVDEDSLALSKRIVRYAGGLPLALILLGSFLFCRKKDQWESAIHNLEKKLDEKIFGILKVSYDALREDEKVLFLDIACFFVGEDKDYVVKVLGSNYSIGIDVLSDMSLINVEDNKLKMHNLIEEVGKEIVRRESPEAGERSRLWSLDEIFHIFSEDTGTKSIQGIMLKLPEQRTLNLKAKSFKKMKRLRLLIFDNVVLSTAIEYLPKELRLIDLPGYQFPTLPFDSGRKQLVILNMPHNHIHEFDKGFESFERLKVLNFSHSKFLRKIPDLSTASNLESLCVDHCESLEEIHESVGLLTKLVTLDAQHCSKLSTVPSKLESKYFRTLDFQGCSRLQIFPKIVEEMKFITSLNLSGTGIIKLPSSIDRIVRLEKLCLSACKKLKRIPSSIYKLVFLSFLDLTGCTNLSKFPNYVEEIHGTFKVSSLLLGDCNISDEDFLVPPFSFPLVQCLILSGNKFVRLPSALHLCKLDDLNLANCQELEEIPELPDCQICLEASHCKSLVGTPWEIMAKIISTSKGFLKDSAIQIVLPGSDIPDLFSQKSATETVIFDVPLNTMKNVAALIICAVSKSSKKQIADLSVELHSERSLVGHVERKITLEPGNMWLIYLPANSLISDCLQDPQFDTTKNGFPTEINRVNTIKVSFDKRSSISSCGIHILQEGDEIAIEGKSIKASNSISHIIDRIADSFADGDNQQLEEDLEEEEYWTCPEELANIFETEISEEE